MIIAIFQASRNKCLDCELQCLITKVELKPTICLSFLLTAHLERSLKIAKDEIESYTESTMSKQKDIANEV